MVDLTSTSLRVSILVARFPNIVQTYILNHIISLKNSGIDTTIIAVSNPKQTVVHPAVDKYKLINETVYINSVKISGLKQVSTLLLQKPRYRTILRKIIFSNIWRRYGIKYGIKAVLTSRALAPHDFDIVHSHNLVSSYEYLYIKEIFHTPVLATFHGFEPKGSRALAIQKTRKVFSKIDAFIVNTHFAKKQLTDLGCQKDKIYIIPQGTNIADFSYKPRTIIKGQSINILSVGRLSVEKGFHIAIKAISTLIKRFPGINYQIIGSGPEKKNLTEIIRRLGLQEAIKVNGSVSTDDLQSYYSSAHIFVLPSIDLRDGSHTETQGVVLQEVQSCGIPVIASKTGGIPEVIKDGETGLLFDEGNDSQLAQLIEFLITKNDLYQSLGVQARKDVEDNYNSEDIGSRIIGLYKMVISRSHEK